MRPWIPVLAILFEIAACTSTPSADPTPAPDNPPAAAATSAVEMVDKAPPPAQAELPAPPLAEQELRAGIAAYENGQHKKSQQLLKNALSLGLTGKSDKVTANKYLAFMACANQQRDVCKGYFRKAVMIDARFELNKAEAGHPMWGKAFKEVKAEGKAQGAAK